MAKQATKLDPDAKIEALGVSNALGLNLPFSTPFYMDKYSGKTLEEGLQEIINDDGWGEDRGPTISQLVNMRRMDGQARALYRILTRPILSALNGHQFVAAEGDKGEAEFLQQVFNLPRNQGGMSISFHRFMSQVLMALFDGFSPFEKVYWRPTKGPLKGKTTLKTLMHLPPETVTFVTNDKGGFRGLRQRAHFASKDVDVYLEPQYCFYFAAQEEERQFYGVSYFESAFYHYDKKMKSYFLAHLAAQRSAVGTRVGTVPINATDNAKREFNSALSNLAFAQFMSFPEGFKVEILREGTSFDFLNYINHHNSQMSKSMLAMFLDESQGSGSNDNAMIGGGGPGDDWFLLQMQAIQDEIAAAINEWIIPDLIDQNFKGGNYPTFKWGNLTDEQKAQLKATFERLAAAGQSLNVTPEFMRELEKKEAESLGLDIDYDAIAKREKEDADRQKAAGIDPKTGQPFPQPIDPATGLPQGQAPTDADGNPLPPGAQNPDDIAAQFQQQALQMSAEAEDEIVQMSRDLLTDARALLTKGAEDADVQ